MKKAHHISIVLVLVMGKGDGGVGVSEDLRFDGEGC